ncbi:hypothetical protein ACH5RR_019556 [Cinchona calisaya]|uniref:Uncharacterized protein n=1 Tax=Cinchona calisaya TaxID=153742 RepID=A0ABD2ZSI7_9GENT
MGGGSGGVGSIQMLKSVQRAVRASGSVGGGGAAGGAVGGAAQEPFSHATRTIKTGYNKNRNHNKNQPITLSSSSSSTSSSVFSPYNNLSTLPVPTSCCSSPTTFTEESDWECIDEYYDDFVFGTVPSKDEVHHAVFTLQEVMDPASPKHLINHIPEYHSDTDVGDHLVSSPTPFETKLDWKEPSLQLYDQSILQAHERVYDAFHLLQNEPSVQRMVISLSSDKAVWDAVLNNEVVQELRESYNQDKSPLEKSDDDSDASDPARDFLKWIIVSTKAKVMELINKITKLVNEFFQIEEGERTADRITADPFEKNLRASFLLSVMVMLIVVVTRSSKA